MKYNKYEKYTYLGFYILSFLKGIIEIFNKKDTSANGWFILAISFLFLSLFFKRIDIKQRNFFIFLTYMIAGCLIIVWIIKSYIIKT